MSPEEGSSCGGLIREEELMESIKSFHPGKTSGLDTGIPFEVYQVFYEEVKKPLLASFN